MHVLFTAPSHAYRSCQQTEVQGELHIGPLLCTVQDCFLSPSPLMDLNTGEPYLMGVAGNLCLEDAFFPSCPGDSLVFHISELAKLAEQGYCIPTYWEKAAESTGSSKTQQSTSPKENSQKPPHKDEESSKHSSRILETSLPRIPNSTSTSNPLHKSKLSPTSKEQKDKCDLEKHSSQPREWQDKHDRKGHHISTKPKESSCSEKDNDSSGSTNQGGCKHHPSLSPSSLKCSKKEAHIDSSIHSSSESSWLGA